MPRVHESVTRAEIAEAFAVVCRRAAIGAPTHGAAPVWVEDVVGMCGGWEALKQGLRGAEEEVYRKAFFLFADWRLLDTPCDHEAIVRAQWISESAWSRIQGEAEKWLTTERQ